MTNTITYVLKDDIINKLAYEVVALQKRENTTIPFLQKQLSDLDKKIENILKAIEDGISNASIKTRLDDLENTKADIEIAIAREKIEKTPISKEQIVFWISRFKGGNVDDPTYRKSIVDIFVNSVFLYDDHIGIGFNWKDGMKIISLAELEMAIKVNKMSSKKSSKNKASADIEEMQSQETPQYSGVGGSYLGTKPRIWTLTKCERTAHCQVSANPCISNRFILIGNTGVYFVSPSTLYTL